MKAPRRPRRISIYVLLSLLILVLSAPALLLFGRFIVETAEERRGEALRGGLMVADRVADALGREFQSLSTMLAVFASSGWIEEEDYLRLHLRAKSALAGTGTYLIVLDGNLNQILNTRVAYGQDLGPTSDPGPARRAIETGRPVVSDLFIGRVADTFVFNMLRPTLSERSRARVLILTRDAASLQGLVDRSLLPAAWSYAIFDGEGRLAAISRGREAEGAPPASCRRATVAPPDDYWSVPATLSVVQGLDGWPWRVCAWASGDALAAPLSDSWQLFRIATVLGVLLSLAAAAILGRIIVGATARAARLGRSLEAGAEVAEESSFVAEIDDVLRILHRAARERSAREEELRLLLAETAHRAKNQIAIASSLVRLSAKSAGDVDRLRDTLLSRFVALSRSVDMLVGRDWQTVSLSQLVEVQLKPFVGGEPDRLHVAGEKLAITPTAAQTLGLVLNELATNASKYGAWSTAEGRVEVEWSRTEDALLLSWIETGGPSPEDPTARGFGTELMETLIVRALGGEFTRAFEEGGLVGRFRLPLESIRAASPV